MAGAIALLLACTQNARRQPIPQANCEADGEFVFIPAGEFVLGSDRTEVDYAYRISAEAAAETDTEIPQMEQQLRQKRWFAGEPQRQVKSLPAVCLRRHLVTNAEYQTFIQATGHPAPGISEVAYQDQGFLVHPYTKVQSFLWTGNRYPPNRANHPVVLVSYPDAQAFARWKSQRDGFTYRLPTATEWEQAARGTEGRYFPWGDQWRDEATNWGDSGHNGTSAIGAYPLSRSPAGVEDMAGNVFEFTATLTTKGTQMRSVMKGCSLGRSARLLSGGLSSYPSGGLSAYSVWFPPGEKNHEQTMANGVAPTGCSGVDLGGGAVAVPDRDGVNPVLSTNLFL